MDTVFSEWKKVQISKSNTTKLSAPMCHHRILNCCDAGSETIQIGHWIQIVFFGPDAEIKTKEKLPDSVNIGPIRYVKSKQDQVFSEPQVDQMVEIIRNGKLPNGLISGASTRKRHIASLTQRHDVTAGDSCPRCNGALVVRKRKSDAQEFLGCSGYPKCRFIKSLD